MHLEHGQITPKSECKFRNFWTRQTYTSDLDVYGYTCLRGGAFCCSQTWRQQNLRPLYDGLFYNSGLRSSAREPPSYWLLLDLHNTRGKKNSTIFQTLVCKQFLWKLSLLESLISRINTMESTDSASIIANYVHTVWNHWGIRCLTLYFDVSLYWVIGLSAIPQVPTPTFPFTLSGEANMLLLTCKTQKTILSDYIHNISSFKCTNESTVPVLFCSWSKLCCWTVATWIFGLPAPAPTPSSFGPFSGLSSFCTPVALLSSLS